MGDRYPFPAYANGWFRVSYSRELAVGEVKPLRYFGRDLVLFRDEDGHAHVMDAFCRHLGAHLGYGGRVEGRGIRCPFHAWLWSGEGECLEIPYAKRIPPGAKMRAWPVSEKNGLVFVWFHSEDEPPAYEVPDLPQVGAPGWTDYEIRRWTVKARWLDMNENAVDRVHFQLRARHPRHPRLRGRPPGARADASATRVKLPHAPGRGRGLASSPPTTGPASRPCTSPASSRRS